MTVVVHGQDTFELEEGLMLELERRRRSAQAGEALQFDDVEKLKADLWSPST